ncbi:MAG: CDP-alcohol phosphatidyltransferase family protein [Clostridia bacterium]|nr:CDP-alcohol phosphatidyltransferase family protein [Clostridia bacterium]
MIGVYDYTVILTYLSLLSAGTGIVVSLSGTGHPYMGIFFLLFCGLCDAFDGKVARTKKNRTEMERNFGIQVDSLSDVIAFGVLPACIGAAMLRVSPWFNCFLAKNVWYEKVIVGLLFGILILYILAAMIRLAYFNVMEEERTKTETEPIKYYTGVPVTTAALIFPSFALLHYLLKGICDITWMYFAIALITGFLFLSKLQIKKAGLGGILIMIGIGLAESVALIILQILK